MTTKVPELRDAIPPETVLEEIRQLAADGDVRAVKFLKEL